MIPMKYKGSDLIGKKCRPTHNIRNGAGDGITSKTVCKIVDVVRGHGFTIQTETCPHCGQYAYIRKVKREELELVDGNTAATLSGWISVEDRLPEAGCHDVYAVVKSPAYFAKDDEVDVAESISVVEGYCQHVVLPEHGIDNRFWNFCDNGDIFSITNEHSGEKGGFEEIVTHWMSKHKPEPPKEE